MKRLATNIAHAILLGLGFSAMAYGAAAYIILKIASHTP